MTTANCPRCSEQVSVPDDASHDATVRCPLCRDEYSLGEALAQLPPSLIVVSDFGEAPAASAANGEGSPWEALNLDDGEADQISLAPLDDASPATAFEFTSGSAPSSSKPTAAIRSSRHSRKPKGSPIKSVLSIVIGGLMAFPIAQLILWYLPGDWKRDFGAGPIVAKYVHPMIVPEKFRGSSASAESNSGAPTQDSASIIPDFTAGGGEFAGAGAGADQSPRSEGPSIGSGFGGGGGEDNTQADNRRSKQDTNGTATSSDEPPVEEQMSSEDATAVGADVFGSPLEVPDLELGLPLLDEPAPPSGLPNAITKTLDKPATDQPRQGDAPSTSEAPQPEVGSLAPGNIRNAPQVSGDDVAQSVQAALSGSLAWDTNEAAAPSLAIKREFYFAFSKLGEALTFADRSDETVATQIAATTKLLHDVSQQGDKLAVIGGVANGWIAAGHESRKTDGICLYGVVQSVEPIGDVFETTIESAGQQIAVVSTSDPSEFFVADREVLILGTILDDPAKNLGGYEGSRAVVVLDGYHVNISAE